MERDLRTLNQRRACHLTSTNAIKKRVEDAEALVIGAEKMAAEIDAAAKKKDESKKAKATVESNKRAKAKVEMQQRRANDLFQAELTLATTMSVTCTHVPDEDDDHAADNECAVCGLCDDCLQDHVTIMPRSEPLQSRLPTPTSPAPLLSTLPPETLSSPGSRLAQSHSQLTRRQKTWS